MSEPFLGEVRIVGFNFAPRGWAFCDGSLQAISQNSALFALLGTQFGGDGRTTFGLPDLRGRFPMHQGNGPALTPRDMGQSGGQEGVTLTSNEIPAHSHAVNVSSVGGAVSPVGTFPAADSSNTVAVYSSSSDSVMDPATIGNSGGGQPHENMPPFLVMNFVIALQGIFPSRN